MVIDNRLTLHDFRMTPLSDQRTNLIFDVVVPSDLKFTTQEFKLPEGLETIGDGAFYNARNLGNVVIPQYVCKAEKHVFAGVTLDSLTLPESLIWISRRAFYNITYSDGKDAVALNIPSDIVYIGSNSFAESSDLTVTFSGRIPMIENDINDIFENTKVQKIVYTGSRETFDENLEFFKEISDEVVFAE